MRAVVIYATCEGQTQRIADCIAQVMTDCGVTADTFNVSNNDVSGLAVDSYQAVVFGSSLHFGEHDPRIAWCIRYHRHLLRKIPSAFFSVSLGVVSKHFQDRQKAERLADEFLMKLGFEPSRKACFAGALCYSKYGWLKKHLMHWIARKSGSETVTDRDYEYTDWKAVERFAIDFVDAVEDFRQPKPSGPRLADVAKRQHEFAANANRCT